MGRKGAPNPRTHPRNLVLVLGDQLDHQGSALDDFDVDRDAIWMAENEEEATHVWCHKLRLAFFFSAMRHYRDEAVERGRTVHYHELTTRRGDDRGSGFGEILARDARQLRPERLIVTEPGDHRVRQALEKAAGELDLELEIRPDTHFLVGLEEFEAWAKDRKGLLLETFYRHQRREHEVLLTEQGKPVGGEWNYDEQNRETFGKKGPGRIRPPRRFRPDALTRAVMEMVEQRFPDHPGRLDHFSLPVTHDEALSAVRDFVEHRLADFGTYEDAMWTGEPFLYHSRLSAALNVKLVSPRYCIDKAIEAHEEGQAPLNSVEGFVRQILGWREFIRGVYWHHMPEYAERNALRCSDRDVPGFFWDGETDMRCVADAMRSVLDHAYAHHIPRLMVLGQLALLSGVHPLEFHRWHMAMYADAVDWVSLPNTLGMSQYGDGGVVGTKPYCATGKYIKRMSNYCGDCRYDPDEATGDGACPFTSLYWDFLARHRKSFAQNRRMGFQMKNLERKKAEDLKAIRKCASQILERIDAGERV
jgi:deoxyribodipyrimidine photolyase-related protein